MRLTNPLRPLAGRLSPCHAAVGAAAPRVGPQPTTLGALVEVVGHTAKPSPVAQMDAVLSIRTDPFLFRRASPVGGRHLPPPSVEAPMNAARQA